MLSDWCPFSIVIMIKVPIIFLEIEEKGVHLLVEVKINGGPAQMLVDTGASQTVLDKDRALKFIGDAEIEASETLSKGLGTDSMESSTTVLESLSIGNLTLEQQEVVLLDLVHVNNSYEAMGQLPVDGVIGGEILKANKAVIDYGDGTISFSL